MNKFLIAPALAAALLLSAAAPAPAISASGESSAAATTRVLVYRCWVYDTAGGNWFGTHQILRRARANAMTACRNNDAYAAVCRHYTTPCEELYY